MCEALVSSIKKVFKYLSLRRQRTPKARVLREMECQVVVWGECGGKLGNDYYHSLRTRYRLVQGVSQLQSHP